MVNPFIALGTLVNAKTNIQNRFVFNGISQIRVIEGLREDIQKNAKRVKIALFTPPLPNERVK